MSEADDDKEVDGEPVRGRGRPRKAEPAAPISRTLRVSIATVEKMQIIRRWQMRHTGVDLPLKELIENGIDELMDRRHQEPVNLTVLAGEERIVMKRLLRFLAHTAKSDPHRKAVVKLLAAANEVADLATRILKGRKKAK